MATTVLNDISLGIKEQNLKSVVKQMLIEIIKDDRELLQELIAEVIEDLALGKAIEEGNQNEIVERDVIFQILNQSDENTI